jgi:thiol-disulfide isomerase/thioredoxin
MRLSGAVLALLAIASGCDDGSSRKSGPMVLADPGQTARPGGGAGQAHGNQAASPVLSAPSPTQPPLGRAARMGQEAKPVHERADAMEFVGDIAWKTWDEGKAQATREGKPIMLLVYADWCPKCRSLAPVFADDDIEAIATKYVMVRHNADDEAPWMDDLHDKYGGYVPRIFFMRPDGSVRTDITSGHPRFPYFYSDGQVDVLAKSMKSGLL